MRLFRGSHEYYEEETPWKIEREGRIDKEIKEWLIKNLTIHDARNFFNLIFAEEIAEYQNKSNADFSSVKPKVKQHDGTTNFRKMDIKEQIHTMDTTLKFARLPLDFRKEIVGIYAIMARYGRIERLASGKRIPNAYYGRLGYEIETLNMYLE